MENQKQSFTATPEEAAEVLKGLVLTTDLAKFDDYLITLQMDYLANNGKAPKQHKKEFIYFFNELRIFLKEAEVYQKNFLEQRDLKAA